MHAFFFVVLGRGPAKGRFPVQESNQRYRKTTSRIKLILNRNIEISLAYCDFFFWFYGLIAQSFAVRLTTTVIIPTP
jgi:hypothetical protein